jgi:hypothetical protein
VATIRESFEGSRSRDCPSNPGISAVDIGCEIGRLVDASKFESQIFCPKEHVPLKFSRSESQILISAFIPEDTLI